MKKLLVALITVSFTACGVKETVNTGAENYSLKFSRQHFERRSSACDSSSCASYEVTYPVFENIDSSVNAVIQKQIEAYVAMGNPNADGWSLEQISTDFIDGYESFQKESPEFESGQWFYEADVDVLLAVDTLISLMVKDNFYTGGAHGGSTTHFININPKTKESVTLDSYFKPRAQERLTQEAEKIFRKERAIGDEASLSESGFEFPNDVFMLNGNYGFTPTSIVFVFNSYEVAPYVYGPTRIDIPYTSLSVK